MLFKSSKHLLCDQVSDLLETKQQKRPIHEKVSNLSNLSHFSGPWARGSGNFLSLPNINLVLIQSQTQFKSSEILFLLNQL